MKPEIPEEFVRDLAEVLKKAQESNFTHEETARLLIEALQSAIIAYNRTTPQEKG